MPITKNNKVNLSERLQKLRKLKRLTQVQLAKLTGIPQSRICRLEQYGVEMKAWDILQFAKALEIRMDDFFLSEIDFTELVNSIEYNLQHEQTNSADQARGSVISCHRKNKV